MSMDSTMVICRRRPCSLCSGAFLAVLLGVSCFGTAEPKNHDADHVFSILTASPEIRTHGQDIFIAGVFLPASAPTSSAGLEKRALANPADGTMLTECGSGDCPDPAQSNPDFCISQRDTWSPPPSPDCDGWDYFYCGKPGVDTHQASAAVCAHIQIRHVGRPQSNVPRIEIADLKGSENCK